VEAGLMAVLDPIRRLRAMFFSGGRTAPWQAIMMPRSQVDFRREVGDGMGSATVMAPLLWIMRSFPEAPPIVHRVLDDGQLQHAVGHPLVSLLRRPNRHLSGSLQWMATMASFFVAGNAYWIKVRDAQGRVVELWWAPDWTMTPVGSDDGSEFLTHYEYRPGPQRVNLHPDDVVHFRHGLDPRNPRLGLSPLASVLREVFTDDEAANFTAALLRNMGVPGLLVAPEQGDYSPSSDEVDETKTYMRQMFTGDRRGEPLVMTGPTKVTQFGFSPEQLNLKELRRIPEERVTAVLGVPAIVAGLGAGLDRSTFCLPADSRVWTLAGPKPIADVREGETVWSFDDGDLVPRRVRYAGCTGEKPLVELRTKNRSIRASANHPVLVRVPGSMTTGANHERAPRYEWRPAGEVAVGEYVTQVKSLPDLGGTTLPDGSPATVEFLQFCGAVVGDGTVSPGVGVRMAMPPEDRCVAAYRGMAESLFTKRGGGAVVMQERERDFGFSSAAASRMLGDLGFALRARTKRVPAWIWGLSRELRLAFLAGVVDTDGHIDKRGALTFWFASEALVHDLRDLMQSVGIPTCRVAHKRISKDRLPNPGRQDFYDAWGFTASSADLVAQIPFVDPMYRERVEENAGRFKREGFDAHKAGLSDDLGFFMVKEIRQLPAEPIYDLEIEESHSFIADGLVVHNTNTGEAREMAYESCIIPAQRLIGEELRHQLAPDFEPDVERVEVGFDLTKVRVLAEDEERMARRWDLMVKGGWVTVGEGRRAVGLPVDETHDVFLRPLNTTELAADPAKRPPPAPGDEQVRKLMAGVLASTRELDDALAAGTSRNGNGHAAG
jgi:hypothetical protein